MTKGSSVRAAVVESLRWVLNEKDLEIADDDDLASDLGVDSLMTSRMLAAVERRLHTMIPSGSEGEIATATTVGALVERLTHLFEDG
jgi:acyl carrier protein